MNQLILTVIFYIWLFLILGLLWLQATNFHKRMQNLQQALISTAKQNADIAQKAIDALLILSKKEEKP